MRGDKEWKAGRYKDKKRNKRGEKREGCRLIYETSIRNRVVIGKEKLMDKSDLPEKIAVRKVSKTTKVAMV